MAKAKWDEETITRRIQALSEVGEDLTCSRVKEIDSRLVGAAISFFGNWGKAVEAAGFNYAEVRKLSKLRRKEKVKKWSEEIVLEKIREVAANEDDISYAYMKEKHSSLVAAACNYVGSWKKALELIGFDYDEVQRKGQISRRDREKMWYRELLLDRLEKLGFESAAEVKEKYPRFHKLIMSQFKSWARAVEELKKKQRPDFLL